MLSQCIYSFHLSLIYIYTFIAVLSVPTRRTINGGRRPGGENEGARDTKNGQQDRMSDQADQFYFSQAQFI